MALKVDKEPRIWSSWNGARRGDELIVNNDSPNSVMSFTDKVSRKNIFRIY